MPEIDEVPELEDMDIPNPMPAPQAAPRGPVTRRSDGPRLNAPARAAKAAPSSRRVATTVRDEQVQPAMAVSAEPPAASEPKASKPAAPGGIVNPLRSSSSGDGLR